MTRMLTAAATLFALCCALAVNSWAGELDAVKARMKERIPVLDDLKARKVIGEDNRGYVAYPGSAKEKEGVVAAENQDRKAVYAAIAAETKSPAEVVGKRRALKIAEVAKPGTMIQEPDGSWNEKK